MNNWKNLIYVSLIISTQAFAGLNFSEACYKKCGHFSFPFTPQLDSDVKALEAWNQCVKSCVHPIGGMSPAATPKKGPSECVFNQIDINTGVILSSVVHSCDFEQSKNDMLKTHVAIVKSTAQLAPVKCSKNSCEEITETYVVCNGARYELVKSATSTLRRDAKKIDVFIDLDAHKANEAVPK